MGEKMDFYFISLLVGSLHFYLQDRKPLKDIFTMKCLINVLSLFFLKKNTFQKYTFKKVE